MRTSTRIEIVDRTGSKTSREFGKKVRALVRRSCPRTALRVIISRPSVVQVTGDTSTPLTLEVRGIDNPLVHSLLKTNW
jgi:hypothetical protein